MSPVQVHGVQLDIAAFSEQGQRTDNQDAFAVDHFGEAHLLALADGMGGQKSGRVAAETALGALHRAAPIRSIDDARRAVREADATIARASESNPELLGGMGCALGFIALTNSGDGPGWIGAHVGDVRILSRSPDGVLRLETRDHTPAFARWEAGEISLDEIADTVGSNRLQRAVGRGGEADAIWLPAAPGWSWLIVSDGIYKSMRLDELANALAAPSADEACAAIRAKVLERGADDNFTAIVARVVGERPARAATGPFTTPRGDASTVGANGAARGRRSSSAVVAAGLTLLSLALAFFAFSSARSAADNAAEADRLRIEVDSLRAVVRQLTPPVDPFGPSTTGQRPEPGANSTQGSR